MTPLLAIASGVPGLGVIAAVFLLAVLVARAYDPDGDVWTEVHSSPRSSLKTPIDGLETVILDFVPDDEYPTGGYTSLGLADHATGALAELLLSSIVHVACEGSGGYVPMYDHANDKLMVFEAGADAGPLDEVTAAEDLSGETFRITVRGIRDYDLDPTA